MPRVIAAGVLRSAPSLSFAPFHCLRPSVSALYLLARWTYLWADGVIHKRPIKVSAQDYMQYMMTWVERQLDNPKKFPVAPPFPRTFVAELSTIYKRMFRGYAHMFHHHAEDFEELGATEHLYHCFKHFVTYARQFEFVSAQEQEPLKDLIASWSTDGKLDLLIKASNTSSVQAAAADGDQSASPSTSTPIGTPDQVTSAASSALAPSSDAGCVEPEEHTAAPADAAEAAGATGAAHDPGGESGSSEAEHRSGTSCAEMAACDSPTSVSVSIRSFERREAVVWYQVRSARTTSTSQPLQTIRTMAQPDRCCPSAP